MRSDGKMSLVERRGDLGGIARGRTANVGDAGQTASRFRGPIGWRCCVLKSWPLWPIIGSDRRGWQEDITLRAGSAANRRLLALIGGPESNPCRCYVCRRDDEHHLSPWRWAGIRVGGGSPFQCQAVRRVKFNWGSARAPPCGMWSRVLQPPCDSDYNDAAPGFLEELLLWPPCVSVPVL